MVENPPAFPNTGNSTWSLRPAEGMMLRDYFAAGIMTQIFDGIGMLGDFTREERDAEYREAALEAYAAADAMLLARQNGEKAGE